MGDVFGWYKALKRRALVAHWLKALGSEPTMYTTHMRYKVGAPHVGG